MLILKVSIGNDNVITLIGLQNALDKGNYINTAIANVTILDGDGNEVSGSSWPLDMAYVPGSSGDYRSTLPDTLSISPGQYTAKVIADAGPGLKGCWFLPLEGAIRTG